ncbi:hypothetical protein L6164_020252 [Bauhinia variegata]|uniref:Uncharacterized protein n=1 Tax=Bauhinia variegata TaxID=167791 RepID=A0ACB9MUJ1_BAUVA|nr:hypothetical protein L6164_020252 [Bauhinia variegata]
MEYSRPTLTALVVFMNTVREELIRSVHVYRLQDGKQSEVEREFYFPENGSYVEMRASPILRLQEFHASKILEGYQNGVWLCIFAFHTDHRPPFSSIPSLLSVTRNPKLRTIPTLFNDLYLINKLDCLSEGKVIQQIMPEERFQANGNGDHPSRKILPVLDQDLNSLPYSVDMSELPDNGLVDESLTGNTEKKRRAATAHIKKIDLPELVKYFGMPIVEASRNLNVGLTVLKRKCREFGIPRWPHRKIKSLDNLIHDLQEEAKQKEPESEAAAVAVITRQRMLESEKENIEKKPFMDIQSETRKFRQDVFKRRHKARAKQSSGVSSSQ